MSRKRQFRFPNTDNAVDIDDLPQPVVGFGRNLDKGEILPMHHHRRTQLVYASVGIMMVKTKMSTYLIPPQRAVWMPAGIEHRIDAHRAVAMRSLYIEPEVARQVAELSGGRQLTIAGLASFPQSLGPEEPLSHVVRFEKDLWDTPIWFLLIVVFAGAEWYLRRKDNLV